MLKNKLSNYLNNYKYIYILIFTTIFISFFLTKYSHVVPGDDMWWHLKTGLNVLEGNFSLTDTFSWIYEGKDVYWVSHEWLSAVIIAIFNIIFGIKIGGYIFTLFFVSLIFLLLIKFNKKMIKNNLFLSLIWFIIGINIICIVSTPRPHLISYVLLISFIYILFQFKENEDYKYIWVLPIISVLWANIHGGSSNLVYILPIMFLLMSLFNFKIGKLIMTKLSNKQFKIIFLIIIINIVCLLINPHTYRILLYPFEGMGNTFQLNFIMEWASPNISTSLGLKMLIPPIFATIFLIIIKEDINIFDLSIFGLFAILTLKSGRFSAMFFLVNTFILNKYMLKINYRNIFETIKNKTKKYFNPKTLEEDLKKIIIYSFSLLLIFNILVFIAYIGTNIQKNKPLVNQMLSTELISKIKETNPKRLFNHYDFGGELIYNDIPVFIDSRADLYFGNILENGGELSIFNDVSGGNIKFDAERIINTYKFDAFLVYSNSNTSKYLKETGAMNIEYDNNKYTYMTVKDKSKLYNNKIIYEKIKK